jgi:hypothetical protein
MIFSETGSDTHSHTKTLVTQTKVLFTMVVTQILQLQLSSVSNSLNTLNQHLNVLSSFSTFTMHVLFWNNDCPWQSPTTNSRLPRTLCATKSDGRNSLDRVFITEPLHFGYLFAFAVVMSYMYCNNIQAQFEWELFVRQTTYTKCEISSSHGGEYDVQSYLLGYTAV